MKEFWITALKINEALECYIDLFSGSLCRQSSTKAWKWGLKVRLYGFPAEEDEGSPFVWRAPPALGPSQIPESAPERDGFMLSSSGGMVVVSSRQGTVPFNFSNNIWQQDTVYEAKCKLKRRESKKCIEKSKCLSYLRSRHVFKRHVTIS